MSQRLIKPGLSVADLSGMVHPITGLPIVPLGYTSRGPVWPAIGGAPEDDNDDEDDDKYTGDDDEDDEEDEDDEPKSKSKKDKKGKSKSDDDDDDEDDDKPRYTQAEYDRVKRRMQAADKRADETDKRLRALENKDKPKDEVEAAELAEARAKADEDAKERRQLKLENAFLATNTIPWVDVEDAMAAAERLGLLEDVVDDSGTVDRKALRAALKDLAKRKPHLVKKAKSDDDDDDADDKDEKGNQGGQRSSGAPMNGKRKGEKPGTNREVLAKKFPILNRL